MANNEAHSLVGAGMTIIGDVSGSDDLRIEGRVAGNVRCENLIVGAGAVIQGNVVAQLVHCGGVVKGGIMCRSIVLTAGAQIVGDVDYESIEMAAGARITGMMEWREQINLNQTPANTTLSPLEIFDASLVGSDTIIENVWRP